MQWILASLEKSYRKTKTNEQFMGSAQEEGIHPWDGCSMLISETLCITWLPQEQV